MVTSAKRVTEKDDSTADFDFPGMLHSGELSRLAREAVAVAIEENRKYGIPDEADLPNVAGLDDDLMP